MHTTRAFHSPRFLLLICFVGLFSAQSQACCHALHVREFPLGSIDNQVFVLSLRLDRACKFDEGPSTMNWSGKVMLNTFNLTTHDLIQGKLIEELHYLDSESDFVGVIKPIILNQIAELRKHQNFIPAKITHTEICAPNENCANIYIDADSTSLVLPKGRKMQLSEDYFPDYYELIHWLDAAHSARHYAIDGKTVSVIGLGMGIQEENAANREEIASKCQNLEDCVYDYELPWHGRAVDVLVW